MLAMMKRIDYNRNYLEVSEIKEFFYQSFIQAYKHLGWKLRKMKKDFNSKNIYVPTIKQLELYAEKYEQKIKNEIEKDLMESGINTAFNIDQETFRKWIYKDHSINIKFANLEVNIATSLIKLDEIGFDDTNLMSSFMNANNQLNKNNTNNDNMNIKPNNNAQIPLDPYSDLNDF
jgi:hypothetical protein